MKKIIIVIALIFSANLLFAQDSRTLKDCNFQNEMHAWSGLCDIVMNADEYFYSVDIYQAANGKWCYRVELRCNSMAKAKKKAIKSKVAAARMEVAIARR